MHPKTAPYTASDLRAEAARQLAYLTEDPDYMEVGEGLEGAPIQSRGGATWDQLDSEDFDAAQRTVHDLMSAAADTAAWAVGITADDMKPCASRTVTITADGGRPAARIHLAFHPGLHPDERDVLLEALKKVTRS